MPSDYAGPDPIPPAARRDWRYRRSDNLCAVLLGRLPQYLLRAEGLAVVVAALTVYFYADYTWWLVVVLALAPDLSLIGFALNQRVGTAAYNAVHTYAVPLLLGAVGVVAEADLAVQVALIWIMHIGVDRAIGYGLKYPTGFKDTHLQRV